MQESGGSISYVPKEKDKDTQLKAAIALLHGQLPETGKTAVDQARAGPLEAPRACGGSAGRLIGCFVIPKAASGYPGSQEGVVLVNGPG